MISFFVVLHLFRNLLFNHSGIKAAHLHQELNLDPVTALSPTKPRRRSLQNMVRAETEHKLQETSGLYVKDNTYSALQHAMEHCMLDDLVNLHNSDPDNSHVNPMHLYA